MKRNNPAHTPARPNAGAKMSKANDEVNPTNPWKTMYIINLGYKSYCALTSVNFIKQVWKKERYIPWNMLHMKNPKHHSTTHPKQTQGRLLAVKL